MRIVAILNQKGGVGKTTTTVNLGAALALRENEVLLIDLDPQGNLTDHLGLDPEGGGREGGGREGGAEGAEEAGERDSVLQPTAYDVLMGEASLKDTVLPTGTPHLSVVPGHQDLAAIELELAGVAGRESRLKDALAKLQPNAYDWVLIDCPPSLGLLSLNAMAAAREVFITLQTEYFALRGLGQLDKIVTLVKEQVNPDLVISGIVATLVDPVTNLAREVLDEVKQVYGHRVFATRIRKNVRLAEAPGHQSHIFAYAPASTGAADYHALADEVEAWDAATGPTAARAGMKRKVPVAIPIEEPVRRAPAAKTPAGPARSVSQAPASQLPQSQQQGSQQHGSQQQGSPPRGPQAREARPSRPQAGEPPPIKLEPKREAPTAAVPTPAGPQRTSSGTFAPRAVPAPQARAVGTPPARAAQAPPARGAQAPPAQAAQAPPARAVPAPPARAAVAPPARAAQTPPAQAVPAPPAGAAVAPPARSSVAPPARAAQAPPARAVPVPTPAQRTAPAVLAPKAPGAPLPVPTKLAGPAKVAAPPETARPAVPSPGLRHQRPWMKPAGK